MKLTDITDIAASGLAAQRMRMATTASNLANAQSTRSAEGGPYKRRDPVFSAEAVGGPFSDRLGKHMQKVMVEEVREDQREPISRFDPGHPDADEAGYVKLPNVNPLEELTNLMSAMRSYEASLVIMRKVRDMSEAAMSLASYVPVRAPSLKTLGGAGASVKSPPAHSSTENMSSIP